MGSQAALLADVAARISAGQPERIACRDAGVSRAALRAWRCGLPAVEPPPPAPVQVEPGLTRREPPPPAPEAAPAEPPARLGRPPLCTVPEADALALRRLYVQTNRCRGKGSMTMAARMHARTPDASPEVAAAILAPRASKHALPVEVRRAMRGLNAAVALHRDPDALALGGIYTPGCMRMVRELDGSLRRLRAGERQSWDDASINFPVVVPWPWGGDRCSDRFGVRVGRFQLLSCIDDATEFCPGFSYTIREKGSYHAEDVAAAIYRVWQESYAPERVMFEGGAWQSPRALAFLQAAGVGIDSAKGRPHSKLVEGFWNRLWTVLSVTGGKQIGRYRGEMAAENDLWIACQKGSKNPSFHFPALTEALAAIEQAIAYLNHEQVESRIYGKWVPAEMHAEQIAARPARALPADPDLPTLAWPVYERAKVLRGMARVTALSPAGVKMPYHFSSPDLYAWHGAPVRVCFDPWAEIPAATIILDAPWQDNRAGTVIARGVECMDSCPVVARGDDGAWSISFLDGHAAAERAKKLAHAAVRREVRVLGLDGRSHKAAHSETRAPAASAAGAERVAAAAAAPAARMLNRWEMLDAEVKAG